MALSVVYILWLLPMSLSQFQIPSRSTTEEVLVGCNDNIMMDDFFGTAISDSDVGIVSQNLHDITRELYRPGDELFTRFKPRVRIINHEIVCKSRSNFTHGYSSLSVLITFTCLGPPCTTNPNLANDGVTRIHTSIFSLFCVGNNTWRLQTDIKINHLGFGGAFTRTPTHSNSLPNPEISEDGKCSICTTDPDDVTRFVPASYNINTGCVSCPSDCTSPGLGFCLTAVSKSDIDLTCCRYVLVPGYICVSTCPEPLYRKTETQECQQRVILERESDFPTQVCPGDLLKYSCSSAVTEDTSLVWDINILGEEAQRIVYTEISSIGVINEVMNIRSILTEYSEGSRVHSILTITVNSQLDIYRIEVSCTINSISPATDTFLSAFLQDAPRTPTGFESTQQLQISVNATSIALVWGTVSSAQYYELVTAEDPEPLATGILAPPHTVSLLPYRTYIVSLYAVNCVGRSPPITIEVVSLSYDKFVINEDEREIAPDFLEVTSVTGSVAPSILCVTSSTRDIAVWSKNGGLPVGVTVSNGYALVGYAVKLNWRKKVHFTDSGTYTCRITSGESGTVTVLEIRLTVLKPPTITSIFPNFPIVKPVALKVFDVPIGYRGIVFTCNAIGWPPPTLAWISLVRRSSRQVIGTKFSHSSGFEDTGYASIDLSFSNGFSRADSGEYSCRASSVSVDNDETTIILRGVDEVTPRDNSFRCPNVKSPTVFFQLQVPDVGCLLWSENKLHRIIDEVSDVIIGGVISQCEDCTLSGDSIVVTYGSLCQNYSDGTIVFRGEITSINLITTLNIFCGVEAWYISMPLVRIDEELKLVDGECSLQVDSVSSLDITSCSNSYASDSSLAIGLSIVGVLIFLLALFGIVLGRFIHKWKLIDMLRKKKNSMRRTIYRDGDLPDNYNPFTKDFNRTNSYEGDPFQNVVKDPNDDEMTVINEYNASFQKAKGHRRDSDYSTAAESQNSSDYATVVSDDDYTTQRDDYTTQQSDYTTQQDDHTTQQDDDTTQQDDNTTQHDDNAAQQDDHTTQQDDHTTLQDDQHERVRSDSTQKSGKKRRMSRTRRM